MSVDTSSSGLDPIFTDFSYDGGVSGGSLFGDTLSPPLNLSSLFQGQTGGGNGGLLGDIAGLVGVVYQGEAQAKAMEQARQLQNARFANQLETIKTTPNVWLVAGAVGLGALALAMMGRHPAASGGKA